MAILMGLGALLQAILPTVLTPGMFNGKAQKEMLATIRHETCASAPCQFCRVQGESLATLKEIKVSMDRGLGRQEEVLERLRHPNS